MPGRLLNLKTETNTKTKRIPRAFRIHLGQVKRFWPASDFPTNSQSKGHLGNVYKILRPTVLVNQDSSTESGCPSR